MLSFQASFPSNARGRRRRSAAVSPAAALLLLHLRGISGSNADNDDDAYRRRLIENEVVSRPSTISEEITKDWVEFAEINAIANGNNSNSTFVAVAATPTVRPSTSAAAQPTAKPTRLQINKVGNDGSPSSVYPLGLCQGDCDNDDDCADNLICHQRGRNEAVPGCAGGQNERDRTDYCILPPTESPSISYVPSHQPSVSAAPSLSHAPSDQPTAQPTAKPTLQINKVGNDGTSPEIYPLGLCQGDCDNDDDCAGYLICHQRGRNEAVPGCVGGQNERDRTDYCILPPTESPSISYVPSHQPSVSAAPSLSHAPSDQPSFGPSQAPSMERSPPVRLRLHWTRGSRWQESTRETYWCLQCRSGSCKRNSIIEVDWCSRSSSRQRFQYYEGDKSLRPMTNPSLCFEENGWNSERNPIKLKRCNGSSRQKWRGFKEKRGSPFEFKSGRNSKYCMTQMHHPKAHERVYPQRCERAREGRTSKWVVY